MTDMKLGACREEGNGMKLTKFHQNLHLQQILQNYGSGSNFYGGPGEEHHKAHAKQPAQRTQRSIANFYDQCAHRYIENLAIDRAAKVFTDLGHEENVNNTDESERTAETVDWNVSGAKFAITLEENEHGDYDIIEVEWNAPQVHDRGIPDDALQYLVSKLSHQVPFMTLKGFTEYKRKKTIF